MLTRLPPHWPCHRHTTQLCGHKPQPNCYQISLHSLFRTNLPHSTPFSSALLSPPSRRKCLTSCYYHGIIPPHRDLRRMERWLSWSKALDSKSSVAEMSPWVRIPLSPLKGEVPQGASPFVFNTFCSFELHTGSMSPFLQLGRIYPTSSSFALCFITI